MLSPLWAAVLFSISLLCLLLQSDILFAYLPSITTTTKTRINASKHTQSPLDGLAASQQHTPNNGVSDLILYSYHETAEARRNLDFFLRHAMHSKADFVFIMNGEYDIRMPTHLANVRVIDRPNRCYDLGAYGEVLDANDQALVNEYKRFIMINASLRGPFFPSWASNCWSDAYFSPISERTKLVGMTYNCARDMDYPSHLQSMVLATDRAGLGVILPRLKCFETMHEAVYQGETQISNWVVEAGYKVHAMMKGFEAFGGDEGFEVGCTGSDVLLSGAYNGTSLHPYDTIFAKTNREWNEYDRKVINQVTEYAELSGYSSYDKC